MVINIYIKKVVLVCETTICYTLVFGPDLKYLNLWHFLEPIFSNISNF